MELSLCQFQYFFLSKIGKWLFIWIFFSFFLSLSLSTQLLRSMCNQVNLRVEFIFLIISFLYLHLILFQKIHIDFPSTLSKSSAVMMIISQKLNRTFSWSRSFSPTWLTCLCMRHKINSLSQNRWKIQAEKKKQRSEVQHTIADWYVTHSIKWILYKRYQNSRLTTISINDYRLSPIHIDIPFVFWNSS